ncbi:hypothetical protein BZK41_22175 [Citrobacter sp. A316]|nr:hypothetical protein BZK41_22175 [Citrobacter sp. A316]
MTSHMKIRQPSPLQRRILIVLAALDAKHPGPVATRDIEKLLGKDGTVPVYGPNLRASCRRMETSGWLRTLRAPNLRLAVELTEAGYKLAAPLLTAEQERVHAEQRATEIRVLPLVPLSETANADGSRDDLPVELNGTWHMVCRSDYVIRIDGSTCMQLWNAAGLVTRLADDPLQIAQWLQACHDAGINIRIQINESGTPDEGTMEGTEPSDRTDTWFCQLDGALRAEGITGLNEDIRQAVIMPGEDLRALSAPARLLHVLRDSLDAFPLMGDGYEENTETALADLLARAGFTAVQAEELQLHLRWSLTSEDGFSSSLRKNDNDKETE